MSLEGRLAASLIARCRNGRETSCTFLNIPAIGMSISVELTSEASLLTYLGVSSKELKKIWWFRERMYCEFDIYKKDNKKRIIYSPDERLKSLQRKIALLLNQIYRVRHPVHGFVANKSVKTNALSHIRKRYILNVDLKDFFPSITEKRVTGVLMSLGIDDRVSRIIGRLCCYNGYLPQGAPTSPVLSNMICFRMDKEFLSLAKSLRCIYTRYADDITFSSHQPMTALFEDLVPRLGHFNPNLLMPAFRSIVATNGFIINPNKAHYADRHSRRIVTGIKINELLNVDRRYVRNIRAALYSVETLGLEAAQEKFRNKHRGTADLGQHLQGKIAWLRHIKGQSDPVFRSIVLRFNKNFPERKIGITPTLEEVRDRAVWVVEHSEGEMAQGSAFFLKDVGLVTAAHCVTIEQKIKIRKFTTSGKLVKFTHHNKIKKIVKSIIFNRNVKRFKNIKTVREATKIDAYHPGSSNKYQAKVLNYDSLLDLAILEHNIPINEYFQFEKIRNDITLNEELFAVGYPDFGVGDKINIRPGRVSSLPVKSGIKLIEVTQKLSQGMSGGPLLDSENAVVGIILKGGPGESRDFATHVEMLNKWTSS